MFTVAGFEVTRVGRGEAGAPTYNESQHLIDGYLAKCLGQADHVAVDIAAADGKTASNTYALFQAGWRGLGVEAASGVFARLALNYQALPQVTLHRGWVTPDNVNRILEACGIPREFGFLSLDIDGYDHDLLAALLGSGFRPRLICVEINERFPPPILFNLPYSPSYVYTGDGCSGQSIAMLDLLRRQHDYVLLGLDYQNAFLAPADCELRSVSPEEAYQVGFANRPGRNTRSPWLAEFEPLQTMPPEEAVRWIEERFTAHRGEFFCASRQGEIGTEGLLHEDGLPTRLTR